MDQNKVCITSSILIILPLQLFFDYKFIIKGCRKRSVIFHRKNERLKKPNMFFVSFPFNPIFSRQFLFVFHIFSIWMFLFCALGTCLKFQEHICTYYKILWSEDFQFNQDISTSGLFKCQIENVF